MEPADRVDDLGERSIRFHEMEMIGVHRVAVDVVEHLAPSLVGPAETGSAVIPLLLQVDQQGVNAGCPRAGRATDGLVDPNDLLVRVSAWKSLFHAMRIRLARFPAR
jgi:hypothetical protein